MSDNVKQTWGSIDVFIKKLVDLNSRSDGARHPIAKSFFCFRKGPFFGCFKLIKGLKPGLFLNHPILYI